MEKMVTVKEAAEVLRKAPISVRRMIAAGQLPAVKVGHAWRVPAAALDRLTHAAEPTTVERDTPAAVRQVLDALSCASDAALHGVGLDRAAVMAAADALRQCADIDDIGGAA